MIKQFSTVLMERLIYQKRKLDLAQFNIGDFRLDYLGISSDFAFNVYGLVAEDLDKSND